MSNKEPGYVYILTNPSFREDWVKIGKSSRPEDHRNASGAYQGAKYFSYNGTVLDEIRKENEIFNIKSEHVG